MVFDKCIYEMPTACLDPKHAVSDLQCSVAKKESNLQDYGLGLSHKSRMTTSIYDAAIASWLFPSYEVIAVASCSIAGAVGAAPGMMTSSSSPLMNFRSLM
jgi:hypothetical protein